MSSLNRLTPINSCIRIPFILNIHFKKPWSLKSHDFLGFDETWQILSHSLCNRNYSKRWLRHIKSKIVRELQIQQRRINPTNHTNSQWCSKPCWISRCRSCEILCSCHNITSTVTNKTHGIIGNLNCSSSNIIYICECLRCSKQYVGESRVMTNFVL